MVIKFVAKAQIMKWSTSLGKSIMIIIPKGQRDAEGILPGDWVKVILKKVSFGDLIKEGYRDNEKEETKNQT